MTVSSAVLAVATSRLAQPVVGLCSAADLSFRPYEARELLEQALAGLSSLTTAATGPMRDILHAYLCLTEAGAGNYESARRHLDQATPRLLALDEAKLLARCQATLAT